MKVNKWVTFLSCMFLISCAGHSLYKVNFGNSISYNFQFDINEIKKSGDFLVIIGKNKEKIVISENFLDEVLNQIKPAITSIQFFDLVYEESSETQNIPPQVIDFRNGLLDEEVLNKSKKVKSDSVIYLWEFKNKKFKALELEIGKNYFLSIYAENYDKKIFLFE